VSLATQQPEAALSTHTVLDHDDMHHLVNGLSLEVTRQADRIRRRSHGQDWPGAASAMTELEEAVEILGRLVNTTLGQAIATGRSGLQAEPDDEPPSAELPTGQYL
jgi:hypothetical protein